MMVQTHSAGFKAKAASFTGGEHGAYLELMLCPKTAILTPN